MSMKKIIFHPGDIPSDPGVYIYRDVFGKVIYVGKEVFSAVAGNPCRSETAVAHQFH